MRKVVLTGLGVVSPLGSKLDLFWERNLNGVSGIRRVQQFDCSPYPSQIGGEVIEFNVDEFLSKKDQRRSDRYSHFAIAAAKMAVVDSGLDWSKEDPTRCAAIIGSGIGGLQTLQAQHSILRDKGPSRCSPFMIPQMITNILPGLISINHNLKGPNFAVVTACASGTHAIGECARANPLPPNWPLRVPIVTPLSFLTAMGNFMRTAAALISSSD